MRRHFLPILTLCLLTTFACAPAQKTPKAQKRHPLPVGTLNAAEMNALFIDRTVESITLSKKRKSTSYYDPNGQVRQLREGNRRNGFWRITKRGRICLQMEDRNESCRAVARQGGDYLKFVIKKNGKHKPVVRYLGFRNGNPLNL